MRHNIIILSEARTGSSLLSDMFRCFSGFRDVGVFFWTPKVPGSYVNRPLNLTNDECKYIYPDFDGTEYVSLKSHIDKNPYDSFVRLESLMGNDSMVIKTHKGHYERGNIEFLLSYPNTKFVLLNRTNKLRQYYSSVIALNDDIWDNKKSNRKIYVDVRIFRVYRDKSVLRDKYYKDFLVSHGHSPLEINYERDLENYDLHTLLGKMENWFDENGISHERSGYIPNKYIRQNDMETKDMILNYSMIKHFDLYQ